MLQSYLVIFFSCIDIKQSTPFSIVLVIRGMLLKYFERTSRDWCHFNNSINLDSVLELCISCFFLRFLFVEMFFILPGIGVSFSFMFLRNLSVRY